MFDLKQIDEDFLRLPCNCQERIIDQIRTMNFVLDGTSQTNPPHLDVCVGKREKGGENEESKQELSSTSN